MSRQQGGKGTKKDLVPLSKGIIEDVQRNSIFGRYSEGEMLAQLKALAVDPGRPEFARNNIQLLWNQIVTLKNVMTIKKSKKRKVEEFVNKLNAPADLVLPNLNTAKLRRRQLSHASSVSCLLNSVDSTHSHYDKFIFNSRTSSSLVTFDDALPARQSATDCSFVDNVTELNCPISQAVGSDESVNGSYPVSPENSIPNEAPPSKISKAIQHLNSPTSGGVHRRQLGIHRRSSRLLNFIGDHLQWKVIPVGPRFQADVPLWNGPVDRSTLIAAYKSDSDNSKWLGTRVWPIEAGNMKTTCRKIGKGRRNSCSCPLPSSVDCIKRHILEERVILQSNLGPSFLNWKFDEMGEQVSKSWSQKEQQTFDTLMQRKSSDEKSFWKRAFKSLSNKHRKDLVDYYFNVYIPNRMSLPARSPSMKPVDTDDEEEEETDNSSHMGLQKKSEGRRVVIAKNTKARYLRSS